MLKVGLRISAGVVVFAGVSVTWSTFHSTIYPYTISQPSSFKHAVLTLDAGKVDYFSPSLGSATTNVQVQALPGGSIKSEVSYLRSLDGHHIRRDGYLTVLGHAWPLTCADFDGYTGKWRIEQITFPANGYIWRLTMSYASQNKNLRSTMARMLRSFKLASGTAR